MSVEQPIPRIALTWLLVAQVLVIVPHLVHLPVWIIGLWVVCAAWRVQIFRMRARYPNGLAKILMMLVAAAGVVLSRGSLIGLDAGAVLLVAAFILKLVEMRTRRDALVLIFLGFFTVVVAYLFDDGMLAGLYSLLPVTALLAALIGLQQSGFAQRPTATLKLAGTLLLQALPLMLVLFLFFPRMGPLWSLPLPSDKGVTGLSDDMAPGDIAELSQSGALAFRASFEGDPPPRRELYWRALTLERFDGRRWSQSPASQVQAPAQWAKQGPALNYSVVMEPSGKPWLFGLDVAETRVEDTRQMVDFHLQRRLPVERSLLYSVTSWPQAVRDPQLVDAVRRRNLQLPREGDPRARAWAEQLSARYTEPDALVQALLRHFNQEPFVYTLRPPLAERDTVDAFLFDSRRGFCAHYAGAMTFVLRAAGIPARVVAGYQGGEINPAGNYVLVHQFDAHAWVEYWTAAAGWTRVDPTFQVAPERIENGLEQAVAQEQSFLQDSPFSPLRYRDIGWINQLRLAWDRVNYGWQRWVLGYQGETQAQVLQRWFGQLDARTFALLLVGTAAFLVALVALWMFKPWRRERDPQVRLHQTFERVLARHGVVRGAAEGPRDFAARAAQALPQQARLIEEFARRYEALRYAGAPEAPADLRRTLNNLRRALPWRLTRQER